MLQPLLELYKLIDANKAKFTDKGLNGDFFIDVYRSQPHDPEMYEYYSLPAVFVDYTMQGQGSNKPRLITLTLHIVVDEMPDVSNVSEHRKDGLNRFLYCLLIQSIIEDSKLGKTSKLRFINEAIIDEPAINYHTQTYEFETYLESMIEGTETLFGEFERLNIYGNLRQKTLK